MVLQMKVEVINFRKSQDIALLWLDCFITKFQNKRLGNLIDPPLGRIGLNAYLISVERDCNGCAQL